MSQPELVTLKVIAARIGVGVKKLHELMDREDSDHPVPVDHDRLRGYVSDEGRIAAWEERELLARVPYKQAVELGRVRTRKAS